MNVSHPNVRPQFVLPIAVILQSLAQPSAGLAVTIAMHVADAGTCIHHAIPRSPVGYADVANAQTQILITFNIFHSDIADSLLHIDICVLRYFELDIKLRVAPSRRMK